MRMMLQAILDTEASNRASEDGSLPMIFKKIQDRIKPEATYYMAIKGKRAAVFFFDCKDSSAIMVELAEPLFLGLKAELTLQPVMNDQELEKGFSAWQAAR